MKFKLPKTLVKYENYKRYFIASYFDAEADYNVEYAIDNDLDYFIFNDRPAQDYLLLYSDENDREVLVIGIEPMNENISFKAVQLPEKMGEFKSEQIECSCLPQNIIVNNCIPSPINVNWGEPPVCRGAVPEVNLWHTINVIGNQGLQFGVVSDSNGVLVLTVRNQYENWVGEVPTQCHTVLSDDTVFVIKNN